jgi:hypothetical protein
MRRRFAVLLAGLAFGAVPAVQASAQPSPLQAVAAKSCSGGYTHGVINGEHKCLRRGQYCARAYKRQYPRYGFRCVPTSSGWRLK